MVQHPFREYEIELAAKLLTDRLIQIVLKMTDIEIAKLLGLLTGALESIQRYVGRYYLAGKTRLAQFALSASPHSIPI